MTIWLADTGPLVALLVRSDNHHTWAVAQTKVAPPRVVTCEAVVAEALFLLKRHGHDCDDLFALIESGFLCVDFAFRDQHLPVRDLMRRYANRPMSLADACLVRMAELKTEDTCIWTLDRDFQVYRKHRRQSLALVSPW